MQQPLARANCGVLYPRYGLLGRGRPQEYHTHAHTVLHMETEHSPTEQDSTAPSCTVVYHNARFLSSLQYSYSTRKFFFLIQDKVKVPGSAQWPPKYLSVFLLQEDVLPYAGRTSLRSALRAGAVLPTCGADDAARVPGSAQRQAVCEEHRVGPTPGYLLRPRHRGSGGTAERHGQRKGPWPPTFFCMSVSTWRGSTVQCITEWCSTVRYSFVQYSTLWDAHISFN